ncbi:positive regulator of sigma E activity [Breznakia sp. PF5-3]|uniref:hypothetical protein n=1 Tax=unclassified Breznakia TaxID=2623764 RepID=UPI00240721F4|nr:MULTISPECIES: hypothetical protein [unclassified Breznakia]MDL2276565.1 hypothetical protein [Breznakia sp. OttesenSCG-928-G09]MDF9825489.1 positive regulator of sigma E activity [Breznakia sp. PM6-1]MDF9836335.1 positive regulator of sigma E activity [Breznakia sp. PF5-3]MDF9838183.1 positive regulator of sigma E activity [Breznakia sp. PFB2-8]MDF9860224.1 positive regulator of sigma E activity [Breznakia sp. PH5-24]
MAKQKEVVLTGKNIYFDKHKRAIYYNKRKNIAYVIPKESEGTFQTYTYRYMFAVIVVIFCELLFKINIWISLAIGVASAVLLEYRYQKTLSSMTQLRNFKPENAKSSVEKQIELSRGAILLRCLLYFALAILMIANLYATEGLLDNKMIVACSCIVSLGAGYMAIKMALILIKKNKAELSHKK